MIDSLRHKWHSQPVFARLPILPAPLIHTRWMPLRASGDLKSRKFWRFQLPGVGNLGSSLKVHVCEASKKQRPHCTVLAQTYRGTRRPAVGLFEARHNGRPDRRTNWRGTAQRLVTKLPYFVRTAELPCENRHIWVLFLFGGCRFRECVAEMLQTDDREVPSMLTTTLAAGAAGCERGDVHEAAPVLATLLRCTRVCVHDRLLHHSVLSKNSICNMPPRSQDLTAAGGACVGAPLASRCSGTIRPGSSETSGTVVTQISSSRILSGKNSTRIFPISRTHSRSVSEG
jgi:hypothetical protein